MKEKTEEFKNINAFLQHNIKELGAELFYQHLTDDKYYEQYSKILLPLVAKEVATAIKPSSINTIEDLAQHLNNNQYTNELANDYGFDFVKICKEHGWVIAYPQSDDLLELDGATDGEYEALDGITIKYYKCGEYYLSSESDELYKKTDCSCFIVTGSGTHVDNENNNEDILIESIWSPENMGNTSWLLKCNIPKNLGSYTTFNIMEDDEVYSNGIILDLSKIINKATN